jgi:hypothetical protein
MSTNLKSSYTVGSGAVLDVVTSVTVQDTRVRGMHIVGSGLFKIEAQTTDPFGTVKISRIAVQVSGSYTQELNMIGVRMNGPVFVSAPASATYTTLYYG